MYCLKCKRSTDTLQRGKRVAKNGRLMQIGNCTICGRKKTQFIKRDKGKCSTDTLQREKRVAKNSNCTICGCKRGKGLVNNFINKLPFEMHMPGHNFLGPGTKLNNRLNPDGTPKAWSKPVDRDDAIALVHDLCYAKHRDTKTRNEICDRDMLQALDAIIDPTISERFHRSLAHTAISAKKRFGWGLKKN